MNLSHISFPGKILAFIACGLAFGVATSPKAFAQTGSLSFTFSDPSGSGYGTVQTALQSDGSLWATSGSFTLTSSLITDTPVGTYQLTPLGPDFTFFPADNVSGYGWDNLIQPASNPSGPLPNGIIFGSVAIWDSSPTDFFLSSYSADSNAWTDHAGGSFSVVPEPAVYALLAGLGALGFATYRRQRKRAVAVSL